MPSVDDVAVCAECLPHCRDVVFTMLFQHVVDAVLAIQRKDEAIDLHMVEIMEMQHKTDMDTT